MPGYGHTNGHKTTPEQLASIFEGLTTNGLVTHARVLTGYIPGAEALQVVASQVEKMKRDNPDLIYVLDRECSR
jgi:pyridoxine kinase